MKLRCAVYIILLLGLSIQLSFAQTNEAANLLVNGDFEGEYNALAGAAPRNVAAGWTPWHVGRSSSSPSFANHDPNYDEETDRIRLDEAGSAQKYFTLFATHHGGIYQEVNSVTRGTAYRFSIYAYVWSSSFEDADNSEDPGDVVVRVGIDPNGGTDGQSDDIIWSTAATFFYDAYRQYAVIATAESSTITVFVESTVGEPRANNYIYLDDAILEAAGSTAVVEGTPTSETNTELNDVSATATPTATATLAQDTSRAGDGQQQNPTPTASATASATPTHTTTPIPTATASATATPDSTITAISREFPETVTHIVVEGDTVSELALRFNSTRAAINRANGLNESNLIFIGQRLIIPVNESALIGGVESPSATPTATLTPTYTPTFTATPTPRPSATPVTYQILPGDTLGQVAQRYNTTANTLAQLNNIPNVHQIDVGQVLLIPSPIPPTATATQTPTATLIGLSSTDAYTVYVVQEGDTLSQIAVDHNTTVAAIAQLNDIDNPRTIIVSQRLRIPSVSGTPVSSSGGQQQATPTPQPTPTPLPTTAPVRHTVQPGDTLYGIAIAYGVSIVELAQLNGIVNYNQLSVGQVITIPG